MTKIYDSVHGFIHFNELEGKLIDSLPFQRLHSLHQLGIAYLVYPGAKHTRFEHSLGVMEVASRIFDRVFSKSAFAFDKAYWRQIVRLAALCHDLGHLPFSHVAEKVLLGAGGHEKWTLEIIRSHYFETLFDKTMVEDLIKISIGPEKLASIDPSITFTPWEKVISHMITGDFFGADRIDYLQRDAQCTGVTYGLFDYHQLIETLCIISSEGQYALGIEENGLEACEALLIARYFMHKRVYKYSSVKAYSFHLARFIKQLFEEREISGLESYLSLTDHEILTALRASPLDDAQRLLTRGKRFKAVPTDLTHAELEQIKYLLHIPDAEIAWELSVKEKKMEGLSFSVVREEGLISNASTLSEIHIPLSATSWIYVDPKHAPSLQKVLRRDYNRKPDETAIATSVES